jgi:HD superfamily phosphohydrolase
MSGNWPKVIRDPVHDIVPFENTPWDRLLLDLIDAREFQRLRRIRQLGVSHLVYPGADHTRFAHSIGVMHTARKFLDRLTGVLGCAIDEMHRTAILAASLLHDIGHGPFSHTFEKVTGESHEKWTRTILLDPSTEIHARLQKFNPALPALLDAFFSEGIEETLGQEVVFPAYLTQIVSSQLDADRFDYLLRDSHATGTRYGQFDAPWLLQNLFLDPAKPRFYLGYKALLAAEEYVYARYHMYRAVYFHKTTRAAEVMLRLLLRRYKELVGAAANERAMRQVVPEAPVGVLRAFSGTMSLGEHLGLDDYSITEFWKACENCKDPVLSALGAGLLHRRLYKAVDVSTADPDRAADFVAAARGALEQRGFDLSYSWVSDTAADTPYKPYDPDAERPATQIYLQTPSGASRELSRESDIVQQLTKTYRLIRYYFPADAREDVRRLARQHLGKE